MQLLPKPGLSGSRVSGVSALPVLETPGAVGVLLQSGELPPPPPPPPPQAVRNIVAQTAATVFNLVFKISLFIISNSVFLGLLHCIKATHIGKRRIVYTFPPLSKTQRFFCAD
ncbi:hypothetical protein DR91_2056 [Neisseria lactamica ATCC 23970]|nr:hypothetical protein DR91_2056 [Neisseria lactamica ATCC 23970]